MPVRLIGDFNGRDTAKGLSFNTFGLVVEAIERAAYIANPVLIEIVAGGIIIYHDGSADVTDYVMLFSLPGNKVYDVMLFINMTTAQRAALVELRLFTRVLTEDEKMGFFENNLKLFSASFLTYILHGGFGAFTAEKGQVAAFLHNAFGTKDADYATGNLASFPNFERLHFPELVNILPNIMEPCSAELRERMAKGIGGNRHFSIMNEFGSRVKWERSRFAAVRFMGDEGVRGHAPYYSFHPDHPLKPMAGKSKAMFAVIGMEIRNAGIDLRAHAASKNRLFIKGVVDALFEPFFGGDADLPSLDKLGEAVKPEFSMRLLVDTM